MTGAAATHRGHRSRMGANDRTALIESIYGASLSAGLFERLAHFIQQRCGIRIDHTKQPMLEGRLRKRMRLLELPTFEAYARYLFDQEKTGGEEIIHFLDAVTTNKTGFFREARHYDFLQSVVLPEFADSHDRRRVSTFRIWSAGCSTGEEPYSLAMVLNEFAEQNPAFSFAILATDLSARALAAARTGTYDMEKITDVSPGYRQKYFTADRAPGTLQMRVVSALRETIMFKRFNFMSPVFPISSPLQAVFCRNVMIYFDRPARELLVKRFIEKLAPGGYLFTGHSESLAGLRTGLKTVANAVYRKPLQ